MFQCIKKSEKEKGVNVSPIRMNRKTVSDFMRFSINSTALVEFNPGIVLTRWFETVPATKQVGEHRIPFKSRTDKCELATTAVKLIKNIKNS